MQNVKYIWSDKKMTRKIVNPEEVFEQPWEYFRSPEKRASLQDMDFLVFIDPIARDGGRNIVAQIHVYKVMPEPGANPHVPPYMREYLYFPRIVFGEVLPRAKKITYIFNHSIDLRPADIKFDEIHKALDLFEISVAKFREVFKNYIPEP